MAKALAEAGADIVCVARRESLGAVEYARSIGRRGTSIQADLRSQSPISEIVDRTVSEFSPTV